ncbi:VOC family protein [Paenibacillus spongiae]|uniref:VOC family protein n=1 Tax=Paenibacillus spongiae TaxID=2909671 RepID=A0ABY5SGW8_9BACL|nr:VOC family protein [Paenibacillus spongiae]UVI33247.1 VOC family protein [Paenibacillus spongiae]
MNKPYFQFDGGFIMVPYDRFEEGVEWYRKHMGWALIDTVTGPVGRKAFFRLPGGGQANLKSFEMDLEHFNQRDYEEGNCRFCFRTANLEETVNYFGEHDIECSKPVQLPDGTLTADIQAFAGVRMTLCEDRASEGQHPEARVIRYAAKPLWLGVRDLEASVAWYEHVLGLERSETDYSDQGFALLRDRKDHWDYVWLQQLASCSPVVKANPGARLYFLVDGREDFLETQRWLKQQDIETTEPVGERWTGYHFYDPDGNRLNVWNYY